MIGLSIKNWGVVREGQLYRGGQPEREQYGELARMGINTIVDLRDDPKRYSCTEAKKAGMRYVGLPMSSSAYPDKHLAETFLSIVTDTNNVSRPFYAHCAGGRHRSGAMVAIYRLRIDGWDLERTMKELESYDFGLWDWRWLGHRQLKQYVEDYANELASLRG